MMKKQALLLVDDPLLNFVLQSLFLSKNIRCKQQPHLTLNNDNCQLEDFSWIVLDGQLIKPNPKPYQTLKIWAQSRTIDLFILSHDPQEIFDPRVPHLIYPLWPDDFWKRFI